ncbi:MAG: hypothetical protein IKZ12_04000 [Alistipes sp.]|nr:hypothetical protein [Alistipes sp.]
MKRILWLLTLLLFAGSVSAQRYEYEVGGQVLSNDALSTADLANLSRQQFNFGTARSMAMAGAFTSLGADQASMALNPAGLGMYQSGEFALTPMVTIAQSESAGSDPYQGNSRSRFGLGNLGAVFNLYEGSGKILSVNAGIGYTRLADYNYQSSFSYRGADASIADAMAMMLEAGGAVVGYNGVELDGRPNWAIDPLFWPAVAGYKTYLVDCNKQGVWYPAEIGANASIEGGQTLRSRGSAGEISFSMGANYDNKLYFGVTIGVQTLYQYKTLYYGEAYTYNGGNGYDSSTHAVDSEGRELSSVMQAMGLRQAMRLDGAGVNFKLGVVYRPVEVLRLGLAFHTPTFYSLDRTYELSCSTRSLGETSPTDPTTHEYTSDAVSELLEDSAQNAWEFCSPARLMLGASYTFGRVALLSVDYERSWFNGIRVKNQPYLPYGQGEEDFKQDFKHYFQGSNTLRVGLEVRPIPMVALRAGYGVIGSALKEKSTIFTQPVDTKTGYFTLGAGVQLGRSCALDLAYCHATTEQSEYMLFYGNCYPEKGSNEVAEIHESPTFSTEYTRHNVALTFSVKF